MLFLVKPTLCCYMYNQEKITPARGFLSAEHSEINWSNWFKPGPVQPFKINRLYIICFKIRQSFFLYSHLHRLIGHSQDPI